MQIHILEIIVYIYICILYIQMYIIYRCILYIYIYIYIYIHREIYTFIEESFLEYLVCFIQVWGKSPHGGAITNIRTSSSIAIACWNFQAHRADEGHFETFPFMEGLRMLSAERRNGKVKQTWYDHRGATSTCNWGNVLPCPAVSAVVCHSNSEWKRPMTFLWRTN